MKTSSCKAKGRGLQKDIVQKLRQRYGFDMIHIPKFYAAPIGFAEYEDKPNDDCYSGDITCRMMGGSGTDIILSPAAANLIPFDIEVKCQENLNIWSALKQAESNTKAGRISLLVFKRNRTTTYCCLKFEDLLRLVK